MAKDVAKRFPGREIYATPDRYEYDPYNKAMADEAHRQAMDPSRKMPETIDTSGYRHAPERRLGDRQWADAVWRLYLKDPKTGQFAPRGPGGTGLTLDEVMAGRGTPRLNGAAITIALSLFGFHANLQRHMKDCDSAWKKIFDAASDTALDMLLPQPECPPGLVPNRFRRTCELEV
jgi:hypothetical protein